MKLAIAALAAAAALIGAVHAWMGRTEAPPPEMRTVEIVPPPGPAQPEPEAEPAPAPEPVEVAEAPVPEPAPVPVPSPTPPDPPSQALVEERLAAPAPFVEAAIDEDPEAAAPTDTGELAARELPAEAEPVDQDAWAARIRRMLAVYVAVGAPE